MHPMPAQFNDGSNTLYGLTKREKAAIEIAANVYPIPKSESVAKEVAKGIVLLTDALFDKLEE